MKSDEQVTVRIPRQTLADCAAAHRAELEQRGLVRERQHTKTGSTAGFHQSTR